MIQIFLIFNFNRINISKGPRINKTLIGSHGIKNHYPTNSFFIEKRSIFFQLDAIDFMNEICTNFQF